MKTLVTGGTGFIGTNLVEKLKVRGHRIVCVSKDQLHKPYLESLGVEVKLGDLNNGIAWNEILSDVGYIYHLAGVTRARKTEEYYEGNYYATRNFLREIIPYCRNIKRFIYVSSLAAAGPACTDKPVNEQTPCQPVSHYGKSKLLAEQEVQRYRYRLPITIIRPSAVYGPRERDLYEYFKIILKNVQPLIGIGRKLLNLIHVDDLTEGIIRAAENPQSEGEIYFLGSERPYYTEEIGNAISGIIGNRPVKIRIPHAVVYMYGAIGELAGKITGKRVFFNLQKVRESIQVIWDCSVKKASEQLDFYPKLSLEEGILQTYQWYLKEKWL